MDKIFSQINKLVDLCDDFTTTALTGQSGNAMAEDLYVGLSTLIPSITEIYSAEPFSSHFSDIAAWIELLKRFVSAVNGRDILLLLDVVSYEIRENLLEVESILKGGM